ncbi:FixH family protein [Alkalihalobacillus sp. R86527]|uniref:FixH family protein n=1 Tax=Alkalihalobacillus sp. R86527 TaxID=3093863 RepID=UPI00367232AE
MKILAVVGLSLFLVSCGTSEDGAKETNSSEMNEKDSGTMKEESEMKGSEEKNSSVGDADSEAADSLSVEIMEKEQDEEGHHDSELMIMLEKASDHPTELTAMVQMEDSTVEGASVRFEYWKEGEEKHIYTDAVEMKAGEYQAKTEIMDEGTYTMKVHVEKGEDLHTHKPYTLEVKTEQSS